MSSGLDGGEALAAASAAPVAAQEQERKEAGAGGASADLQERAGALLAEEPKIDAAMRNLLAVKLAQQQVYAVDNVRTIGAQGEVEEVQEMSSTVRQKIAGAILRGINGHEYLEPLAWAEANPQGEEQGGLERIEEVTHYKVVHFVCSKARANGAKVTKTLGRSGLRVLWPQVREKVMGEVAPLGFDPAQVDQAFSDMFAPHEAQDNPADSGAELVWSRNFHEALQARVERRKKAVQDRNSTEDTPTA